VSALQILGVLRSVSKVTEFTLYSPGVNQLYLFGFLAMTFSGAIYYIAPRIANSAWPSPKLIAVHFSTATIGTALIALPLIIGGLVQGLRLNNASVNFMDVVRSTKPFLGTSTLGGVLLLVGSLSLLLNLGRLACSACCGCCLPGHHHESSNKKGTRS
jgi:cytochrome c oxidase cbb3-type subunit 1